MPARDFLRHNWHAITSAVTAAAIACAALVMLRSMPPHRIVMATGPEGGTYYEVGKRSRSALARENVEVQLAPTPGSVENLAMLRDPHSGVSVALIQSGIVGAENTSGVESLGTVFYEPMWWFHRREIQGVGLDGLRGRKVSIGPEGSGTRALALELLKRAGVEQQVGELLALEPRAAAEKLLAGEIDVAFIMASSESPVVEQLLADDRIQLLNCIPRFSACCSMPPWKFTRDRAFFAMLTSFPPPKLSTFHSAAKRCASTNRACRSCTITFHSGWRRSLAS